MELMGDSSREHRPEGMPEGALHASAPMRAKRLSQAERVVATASARQAREGDVEALPSTRLERKDVNGKPTLTAIFAGKGGGKPHELDLSHMLDFPGLCELFARGFLAWGKDQAPITRCTALGSLRRYWFGYLRVHQLMTITPDQLNEQVMAGFKEWLNHRKKRSGKPLSPNSIRMLLGSLRVLLRAAEATELLDSLPTGPRGSSRKSQPTEVLRLDELLTVMEAVEKEILALRDRWARGRQLLVIGRRQLVAGIGLDPSPWRSATARSQSNLALALAILDQRYPGVIPDLRVISSDDPLLGATVQYAFGNGAVKGYFQASARDLVPLVLALAFATVFNPDTVLKLEWKNIDRNIDRMGDGRPATRFDVRSEDEGRGVAEAGDPDDTAPLTRVTGDKPRAQRQLVRLLDPEPSGAGQVSLNLVLDLVTEMTARIRPYAIGGGEYVDRVFIFVQQVGAKRPKGFGSTRLGASGDPGWKHGLKNFIDDNNLPAFTFRTIRATLLDYVQLFSRGDLEAARAVGNHRSRVTTWTHYTSSLVKRLLQEATGETLLVRERWLNSEGVIDPRPFQWTNKGCATPGFHCLDPFDSARPNQKKGRLCAAYGECPDCPLSAAVPNNPRNVMLYEALRRAIYRSVSTMTAPMWQLRWAPVVAALDALLANVPPAVLEKSRQIAVELPSVG
jgi:hypothetical protein